MKHFATFSKHLNLGLIIIVFTLLSFGLSAQIDTFSVNWELMPQPPKGNFEQYYKQGNKLFATEKGQKYGYCDQIKSQNVYLSLDNGVSWNLYLDTIAFFGCTDSIIYFGRKNSLNFGNTIIQKRTLDDSTHIIASIPDFTFIYNNAGVDYYREKFFSQMWQANDSTLYYFEWDQMTGFTNHGITCSPMEKYLYYSTNYGKNWHTKQIDLTGKTYFTQDTFLINDGKRLVRFPINQFNFANGSTVILPTSLNANITIAGAGLINGGIYFYYNENDSTLVQYSQFGNLPWNKKIITGFKGYINEVVFKDETVYISGNFGMIKSINLDAGTFTSIYNGQVSNPTIGNFSVFQSKIIGNTYNGAILSSDDAGQNWTIPTLGKDKDNIQIIFTQDNQINCTGILGAWSILNAQNEWEIQKKIAPKSKQIPIKIGNSLLCANYDDGVIRSTDQGLTWEKTGRSAYSNDNFYVEDQRVFYERSYSNDEGVNWQFTEYGGFEMIAWGDTMLFIDQSYETVKRSEDIGITANLVFSPNISIYRLIKVNEKAVALSKNGEVFISNDKGDSWTQTGQAIPNFSPYYVHFKVQDSLLILTKGGKIYISKNLGFTWALFNFPGINPNSLAITGNNLFVLNKTYEQSDLYKANISSVLNDLPAKLSAEVKGNIFLDKNNNCSLDATSDRNLMEQIIKFSPRNYTTMSDINGKYSLLLPLGQYTVSLDTLPYHTLCLDSMSQNLLIDDSTTLSKNLALQAIPNQPDIAVLLTNTTPARPGFPLNIRFKANNIGTISINNPRFKLVFPKNNLDFIKSNPLAISLGDTLFFTLDSLETYTNTNWSIDFVVKPSTLLADSLIFVGNIENNYNDISTQNDKNKLILRVRGSFDPNDKQVNPPGNLTYGKQTLDYTIRFQNTGTDTAFTVEVIDTLSPFLEVASLKILDASHPYTLKLTNSNVIKWTFDQILLPDSNTNEVLSHGFIRYSINTSADFLPFKKINNQAAIYFDFNEPVFTNTTQNCGVKTDILLPDTLVYPYCWGTIVNGNLFTKDSFWFQSYPHSDFVNHVHQILYSVANPPIVIDTFAYIGNNFLSIHIDDTLDSTQLTVVYPNNPCDKIIIYNIKILVNTNEEKQTNNISISPNPNTGTELWVKGENLKFISILNQTGVLLRKFDFESSNSTTQKLDLKGINSGFYFVKIETKSGQIAVKKLAISLQ
jgi:uncharacterized repeat protein (TIGR01451 family)